MKLFLKACFCLLMPASALAAATAESNSPSSPPLRLRVATVINTTGCVAFWDFVKREPEGAHRFTADVPKGATNDFALDAGNDIKDYWGDGREASYADFPLLGRGPFGQAIRIRKEEDKTFRPFLFVPRARLHDSPIDIQGAGRSVSVVVWAIRESGNPALAGIWHEGTDLNHAGGRMVRTLLTGKPLAKGTHTAKVTLPHEVSTELGIAVKAASPFRRAMVISLANDLDFYIPTRRAFEEGNYEPTTCPLEPGCGERLVAAAVKLLNELKP